MATPPDSDEDTLDVSALKAAMRRALENDLSRQKQKTRVKKGSNKYLRLKKFIETRRQKKLEKRCTLDRSAQVMVMVKVEMALIMVMVMVMLMVEVALIVMMMMMMTVMVVIMRGQSRSCIHRPFAYIPETIE